MHVTPEPTRPGVESVWSYPRPAVAEPCARRIRIMLGARLVAESLRSVRTLETSHPPSYYLPPGDVDLTLLRANGRSSVCEWKGVAGYFDLQAPGRTLRDVAWSYRSPAAAFAALAGHLAFYAGPFDCSVDGEPVVAQVGGFYGGWITSHVAGPFKGAAGTGGW